MTCKTLQVAEKPTATGESPALTDEQRRAIGDALFLLALHFGRLSSTLARTPL